MDTQENKFVDDAEIDKRKEALFKGRFDSVEVKIEDGRYIPFPLGQCVAINGYWFKVIGMQNDNQLILEGVGMTEGYKKKMQRG